MSGIRAHMQKELDILSSEAMPVFHFDLKCKGKFIRLVPLGDIHYGHRACMVDKVKKFIKYVAETPDTFTILMGDLMENVLPDTTNVHRGSMWEQSIHPSEQYDGLVKMLKLLADKKKILFGLGGTHSIRSWYATEFDPEEQLAKDLGYQYAHLDGLAILKVGNFSYKVHAVHGTGSTGDPAAVLRKILSQPKRIGEADIYLRGHHHSKVAATDYRFSVATGMAEKALYVGTGSFLGYTNTYAHRAGYSPAVPGAVKLKLYKEEKDIYVTV